MIRYQKNPKGSSKIIEVDRQQYQAKYIGKGQYSKVYRVGDRVVYYTRGDCSKEMLAMFRYERMTHLPEIIGHENIITGRGTWHIFSSPYYRNVTAKDTSAWELMNKIIRVYAATFHIVHKDGFRDVLAMNMIVNIMKNSKVLPNSVIKALQEIVYVSSNCGDGVGFDLHKANFGVNEYGTLIFRDPVYVN